MRRTRFITWCRRDTADERKINYKLTEASGNVMEFTSDDFMPFPFVKRLGQAWVRSIVLKDNEWYADLYEGD